MVRLFSRALPLLTAALLLSASAGCAAVFPEVKTPLRDPSEYTKLEPAPPDDVYWIGFMEGKAPAKTRDGRPWHELGNELPDPYAILFVNGKELIRTNPQSNTLSPTWPDSPKGNFKFAKGDRFRIEMWESSLVAKPMCIKELGNDMNDWGANKQLRISCDGGAEIVLHWERAHGRVGFGFNYEFRTQGVYVTRVLAESPAARAGLKPGDELAVLGGRNARQMQPNEVQGYINAPKTEGIQIEIRRPDNTTDKLTLKEGAVYPLFSEVGPVP